MSAEPDDDFTTEIVEKIKIARYVVSQREKFYLGISSDKVPDRLERAICYYTGINRTTVHEALEHLKNMKSNTFLDWYKVRGERNQASTVPYEHMKRIITDQYVNKLMVPTKATLVEAISNMGYEEYTADILTKDLNSLGFMWKRLNKSNKFIIVEKNEQISTRMKYLHKMKEYRDNNRVIVHLERTLPCFYYVSDQRVSSTEIIVVASPALGVIDTYFPPKLQSHEFWLRNRLHTIPEKSVFVIEQSNRVGFDLERICELPNIHSQRQHMVKWLDTYNIPYDPMAHKGDLFALIEKYKVHCPTLYKCCEILKAAGHDVILRPPELTYMKYFKVLLKDIFQHKSFSFKLFKSFLGCLINTFKPEDWIEQDRLMAEQESEIFVEDQKLELILDKLMEGVKNKGLTESDFGECEEDVFDSEYCNNIVCDSTPVISYKVAGLPGLSKPGPSKP